MQDSQPTGSDTPQLSPAAISALLEGKQIEAIKIVRSETGAGLKAAKDAVDSYGRTQPTLQSAFAATRARAARKGWFVLIVAIGLALLVYWDRTKT